MQQTSSRKRGCAFRGSFTGGGCDNAALEGQEYCSYHLGPVTPENVRDRVVTFIAEETGFDFDEVSEEMRLEEDLDCDSLNLVDVTMRLEDELNFEIPDEDVDSLQSVGDYVAYVKEHLWKQEAPAPPPPAAADVSGPESAEPLPTPHVASAARAEARHTERILNRTIKSELFRQYYEELELDEEEIVRLFRQVMGNRRIYYVTPVVGYRDEAKQEAECVHLFLLGRYNLFYFKLLSGSVKFEWAALKDLRLSYEVTLDDDKKISMISVTSSLGPWEPPDAERPPAAPGEVDCDTEMNLGNVAFHFVEDEIKGALEFLDQYLNNLEAHDE